MIGKLSELMEQRNGVKGFILDGFPRTIAQGEALDTMMYKHNEKVSIVISLEVEEEELINRILKRGEKSGRSDDNRETVELRLKVYHERTEPLKNFYIEQGKLVKVQGEGDIDEIFESITTIIDRLLI